MKLTVENLGSIKNGAIDIAPLTVFIGPNNANKTWTAYALYALAQVASTQKWFFNQKSADHSFAEPFESALQARIDSTAAKTVDFISDALKASPTTPRFTASVSRSELFTLEDYPLTIKINSAAIAGSLAIPNDVIANASATIEINKSDSGVSPESVNFIIDKFPDNNLQVITELRFSGPKSVARYSARVPIENDNKLLRDVIAAEIKKLALSIYGNVVAFPAERITMVSLYATLMAGARSVPLTLSQPINDFASFLQYSTSWPPLGNANELDNPKELMSLLENRVLEGRVQFTAQAPRVIEYAMPAGKSFRVHAASSLVKSLAGLHLYLNIAGRNDVIIIDEPEMNAHPEAQLAITELLAILVNRGIKVIITTHSPYIVDHLKNLVVANDLPNEKKAGIVSSLKLRSEKAMISHDNLAVYLFNDGAIKSIYDPATRIIDWSTFGNASDYLSNLYSEIAASKLPTEE